MADPFLIIKIATPTEDGPGVSIRWLDAPESEGVEIDGWADDCDQAWTKICDGIHGLLANLGLHPEGGWDVEFNCPNPNLIIEKGFSRKDYHNRHKEESSG